MPARGDDPVELTDLTVIRRWSLAVRGGTAQRQDLVAALRDDLAWLESGAPSRRRTPDDAAEPGGGADAPATSPAPTRRRRPRAGVRVSRRG